MNELLSIRRAAELGIARVRNPIWADPLDHLKIDIIDGKPGPWLHLYAPFNKECNGRDPVRIFAYSKPVYLDTPEFEEYQGPLPDSDEYKARTKQFAGFVNPTAPGGGER